jgi:aminoglycoside phosphotransferase (APT) family kinase protein
VGRAIEGGNSNVTRIVETDGGKFVLRYPPQEKVSDRAASGIKREFAALRALYGEAQVPEPVAFCDDPAVFGRPFSVSRFVEGVTITDRLPADYSSVEGANAIGRAMLRSIGTAHKVDPNGRVPDWFGRQAGFVKRQIDRWERIRTDSRVRDLALLEEIARWLRAHEPAALPARIVHCDFHLDNCLSSTMRPEIAAIIDWEMATLADPRIDPALALFFWKREPGRRLGFPSIQAFSNRQDVVDRPVLEAEWSEASGKDPTGLGYFMIFAAWRLAAIVEGAYVLYRQRKVDSQYARNLETDVPALLEEAADMINQGAH